MDMLSDMDSSGQVAILDTIGGNTFKPSTAVDLLLSNHSQWWSKHMAGYTAYMSFVQCCIAVLQKLPPPYDQMETVSSLCVEVMTEADESRTNKSPAAEEDQEELGPPIRLVLVEQCITTMGAVLSASEDTVESSFAASRAASGLLHMMVTRAASNEHELAEMLTQASEAVSRIYPEISTVGMLIQEVCTVAHHPSILPEHFASRLMPRLTLIKLLINIGGMGEQLRLAEMEEMLKTFADLNRLEMLLLSFWASG